MTDSVASLSSTRYSPENCVTLCWMPCHVTVEKEKQGLYRDLMLKRLGEEGYKELANLANTMKKRSLAIRECMELLTKNL